eukprot:gnl/TRDRNA2_/TRDRNA2_72472_c0_seq1.p1 gnl/TRDRNA2_/TRDRNA2_72472_c0~~gnl/TRDRNA2_/TRDRNA2_72472_c0_seq1.p1  ORF type:complete len:209 (+),score=28.47 gnl/TRDRNA2_/TRDRNA2_72472_c0_seq1:2-628(+)
MYYIESTHNRKFATMLDSMWWGVSVLTTVGYGDINPLTPGGKVLASICACLGVACYSLPAAILASGFQDMFYEEHTMQRLGRRPSAQSPAGFGHRLSSLEAAVEGLPNALEAAVMRASMLNQSMVACDVDSPPSTFQARCPGAAPSGVYGMPDAVQLRLDSLQANMNAKLVSINSKFDARFDVLQAEISALRAGQDEVLKLLRQRLTS